MLVVEVEQVEQGQLVEQEEQEVVAMEDQEVQAQRELLTQVAVAVAEHQVAMVQQEDQEL
jgi:hypothetical protein